MRIRWAAHIARMGEKRNTYWVLVGRRKGKRPRGQRGLSLEDDIKVDLEVIWFRMGKIWRAVAWTFLLSLTLLPWNWTQIAAHYLCEM